MILPFLPRPGVPGAPLPGRAILSMNGLSYGVIRVNTEDKNSALTVQDVGHVMPGGEGHGYRRGEDVAPKTNGSETVMIRSVVVLMARRLTCECDFP